MTDGPVVWVVEVALILAGGVRLTEQERRAFFQSVTATDGARIAPSEVGWISDDAAYVALTVEAVNADAASVDAIALVRRLATVSAGLTEDRAVVTVRSVVTRATQELERHLWADG